MRRQDEYDAVRIFPGSLFDKVVMKVVLQEDKDWGFIAMVLDRLFLWMFTVTTVVGSVVILITAPALYDTTSDMAIKYSLVAQQLYGIPDF